MANGFCESLPIPVDIAAGSSPKQDAVKLGATDILPKPYSEGDFLSKVHQMLGRAEGQLTSDQIFGDFLAETSAQGGGKKSMSSKNDVDKLIADTLSGVMKPAPRAKTQPGSAELDTERFGERRAPGFPRCLVGPVRQRDERR